MSSDYDLAVADDGAAVEDDGRHRLVDDLRAPGQAGVLEGVEDFDGEAGFVGATRHVEDFEAVVGEEAAEAARGVARLRRGLFGAARPRRPARPEPRATRPASAVVRPSSNSTYKNRRPA